MDPLTSTMGEVNVGCKLVWTSLKLVKVMMGIDLCYVDVIA